MDSPKTNLVTLESIELTDKDVYEAMKSIPG
jgi:hypothetical protein